MSPTDPLSQVIAVAGPPGSGKSTLCEALVERLGDAAFVCMDHYQRMTALPIDAVERWMSRGADHDELPVPHLAEHLAQLTRGKAVVDPATGAQILPRRYVVLETHFGRAHSATGRHIDLLVWLDTPLDIALQRNLRGFLRPLIAGLPVDAVADELRWIDRYLENYGAVVSRLVHMQAARVRPEADLVIAADRSVEQAVDEVLACLGQRGQ